MGATAQPIASGFEVFDSSYAREAQKLEDARLQRDLTMLAALCKIARGKVNCGLPLARAENQAVARAALVALGEHW